MAVPLPFPVVSTPIALSAEQIDADRRWAEWRAKGAAHDRAFRRKAAVLLPLLIAAAAISYALLIR